MKSLTIPLPGKEYEIVIGAGLLLQAGERIRAVVPKAERLFVVTDSNVAPLYLGTLVGSLKAAGFHVNSLSVPAGEASKTATMLSYLWEVMLQSGLTRTDAVVALGGGVVGDLAGFAAATVLRGVDFIQIPTTLLAQVDSSVGGKVAVDLAAGKNLAGAFHQPKLVLMDTETLVTLTDEDFAGGMAEVIKYGCIRDKAFFEALAARPSREAVMEDIETVLETCCAIKAEVVTADERDTGVRMILNFGHTLGHAYELAGHYERWTHGQAVAAGMLVAWDLGETMGITHGPGRDELKNLLEAFGLPTHIPCEEAYIRQAVGRDKKGSGEDIHLVLLHELGHAAPVKVKKDEAIAHFLSLNKD